MQIKKKALIISLIFGVITIPIAFTAFTFALGGGFSASMANINYAIKMTSTLGIIVMVATYLFSQCIKSNSNKTSFIFGAIFEVIIYFGFYIHTAMVVHI